MINVKSHSAKVVIIQEECKCKEKEADSKEVKRILEK